MTTVTGRPSSRKAACAAGKTKTTRLQTSRCSRALASPRSTSTAMTRPGKATLSLSTNELSGCQARSAIEDGLRTKFRNPARRNGFTISSPLKTTVKRGKALGQMREAIGEKVDEAIIFTISKFFSKKLL